MTIEIKTEMVRTQDTTYWHAGKPFKSLAEGQVSAISDGFLNEARQYVKSCSSIDFTYCGRKAKVIPTLFNKSVILTYDHTRQHFSCKHDKTYDEVFTRLGIKQQFDDLVSQLTTITYWSDLPIHQPKWSVIDMHREFSIFMYTDFAVVYSSKVSGHVDKHEIEIILNLSSS